MTHPFDLRLFFLSTVRIASSNTSLSPVWVSAEHSTYLAALIFFATRTPSSYVDGFSFFLANFSISCWSFRKSVLVPTFYCVGRDWVKFKQKIFLKIITSLITNKKGVFGECFCISCTHNFCTFTKLLGNATEKHTRNTSVFG